MTANFEQLSRRIEEVVNEHLAGCRREAEAALERAFGSGPRKASSAGRSVPSKGENRRSTSELTKLRAQLFEVLLAQPGETMAVLAMTMSSSVRELQFPMRKLKQDKQVRSAGQRGLTRYFPMTVAKSA